MSLYEKRERDTERRIFELVVFYLSSCKLRLSLGDWKTFSNRSDLAYCLFHTHISRAELIKIYYILL